VNGQPNDGNDERQTAALLRLAGSRPLPAAERSERVRNAVKQVWRETAQRRRRTRIAFWGAGLAAAAALTAVAIIPGAIDETPQRLPTAAPAVIASVQSLDGVAWNGTAPLSQHARLTERSEIETADGTFASLDWNGITLRLSGGTRVRLDSARIATLHRGTIYVAADGVGGVRVQTPFGLIRDIGTRFDVRVADRSLRVRVRSGVIELRRERDAAARVAEGMQVVVEPDGATTRMPAEGDWSWVDRAAPPIRLEGLTLGEVVERVARERGLRVDWREPAKARHIQLHGQTSMSPDEALAAASAACGVEAVVESERLIVRSKR
jgi:ferric-dicitrate binding protein FerR (iron transport regulator)